MEGRLLYWHSEAWTRKFRYCSQGLPYSSECTCGISESSLPSIACTSQAWSNDSLTSLKVICTLSGTIHTCFRVFFWILVGVDWRGIVLDLLFTWISIWFHILESSTKRLLAWLAAHNIGIYIGVYAHLHCTRDHGQPPLALALATAEKTTW